MAPAEGKGRHHGSRVAPGRPARKANARRGRSQRTRNVTPDGKFRAIKDPEGNRVELWEPASPKRKNPPM